MSSREQMAAPEPVQPEVVFAKATEILDIYGQPSIRETSYIIPAPWRIAGIWIQSEPDIPITQAPITPVQIEGNEYRLWLKRDSKPVEGGNTITLSIHFQTLPDGLDRIEHNAEGYVTGYWYKSKDGEELEHISVSVYRFLPKELDFRWWTPAKYIIKPDSIIGEVTTNIRPEISSPLEGGNDFLLRTLEQMQGTLNTQPR